MHGGAATSVSGVVIPMFRLRIPPRIRRLAMSSVLFVLAERLRHRPRPQGRPQ